MQDDKSLGPKQLNWPRRARTKSYGIRRRPSKQVDTNTLGLALQINSLEHFYGSRQSIKNFSLEVTKETTTAILGPNGAGKSTLFSLINAHLNPSAGNIQIFGKKAGSLEAQMLLGSTAQEQHFPQNLRTINILKFTASHYRKTYPINELITAFQLDGFLKQGIGGLSGGQKRRLALACAFSGQPKLLILDEPTTGLDIQHRNLFFNFLKSYQNKTKATIILSTHHMDEVKAVADTIILMNQGQIIMQGSLNEIKDQWGYRKVSFKTHQENTIEQLELISRDSNKSIYKSKNSDQAIKTLIASKTDFSDLLIEDMSLEEIFLQNV